jgi:AcrR family transcriptional regulator
MAARGAQTRENLLDAAERLFGERGVAGVSLREIRIASGARNTGALQFHFRDRAGLLDALTKRHLPRIAELQEHVYDDVVARRASEDGAGRAADRTAAEGRGFVEVLVRPVAEYLTLGPSERAWVKIMAELGTRPDMPLVRMSTFAPAAALTAGNALFEQLRKDLPAVIAGERMVLATRSMVNVCADRARLVDDPERREHAVSDAVFVENLVDMTYGSLVAPLGAALVPLGGD